MNPQETPSQYSIQMLFDPTLVNIDALKAAATQAAQEKFGANFAKYSQAQNWSNPFRNGDEKSEYEDYAGKIFVRASTKYSIGVVNELNQLIEPPQPNEPDVLYSGAYYRATVRPFAFDFNGKRGVKFYLNTLQKLADGKPFGGARPDATFDFGGDLETTSGGGYEF